MSNAIELVQRFCDAFGKGLTPEEVIEFFTPDAVYHNIPVDPVTGHDGILGMMSMFLTPGAHIEFRVRNIAAAGDVVMTERVDVFQLPCGTGRSQPGATTSTSTSTCRSYRADPTRRGATAPVLSLTTVCFASMFLTW